jgi:hypothetical protein
MEIHDLNVFLDYFDKIHKRTMRVVRCIPPDKVDWSFREGKFTLGDLARHIAAVHCPRLQGVHSHLGHDARTNLA